MKTFEYVAVGPTGIRSTGRMIAESELQVDRNLESRGLTLSKVAQVKRSASRQRTRMSQQELVNFTNQLATVLAAGVPIVGGIADIAKRMRTREARVVLQEVVIDLEAGHTLAESLDHQAGSFPLLYRDSIRAGELSGDMPGILRRLSGYLDWSRAMRTTTIQALVYPTILTVAILGLIVVLLTFLLPRIITMFPGGVQDLPRETQILIAISGFLTDHAIPLGSGLAGAVILFLIARKRPRGRIVLSRIALGIPRFGEVCRMLATSKFASTASTLYNAGCDVYSVIQGAGRACGNAYYTHCFEQVADDIRQGKTITASLESRSGIDPLLIQVTNVGEQSGDLGGSLERLSEFYDQEVPRTVKWFLAFLEPAILVVAGSAVAFILMAALMPLFSLYDNMT